MKIAPGVHVREHPARKKPWGVHVAFRVNGVDDRRSAFYATEAEAHAAAQDATAAVALVLARHTAAQEAAKAARRGGPAIAGSFQAYATGWLASRMKLKPATRCAYEINLRLHIFPRIGHLRLDGESLTIAALEQQLIQPLAAAGMKTGTLKNVVRVVSSCLAHARRTVPAMRGFNPAAGLCRDIARPDDPLIEPNPLTAAQAEAFLSWVRRHPRGGDWYAYFLCLFHTGMRVGEAAALKVTDLDLAAKHAYIRASYSPVGQADGRTKTWRARPIDLSTDLVEAITAQLEARTARVAAFPLGAHRKPYVFLTATGQQVKPDVSTMRAWWDRGMTAIGLAHAGHTPHDARDTFATTHLMQHPERLMWVSHMLGHRHANTTLTRYTRFLQTSASAGYADAFGTGAKVPRLGEASDRADRGNSN